MKNLFNFVPMLVMLFVLASCNEEDQEPMATNNEVTLVSTDEALAVGIPAQEVAKFDNPQNFRTRMKGEFEVPKVETDALGVSLFRVNKDTTGIYFILGVNHIENVTAAHIHMAPPDEVGPVVVPLFMGPTREGNFVGPLNRGMITAEDLVGPLEGMTIADLVWEMEMGNTYVNVHTVQNPAGEIRGQIR